jgi:protein TonB
MIEATERQQQLTGWIFSALFHAALLFFGAALLIRPAKFHVNPGRTSTEIEFSVQLPPAPPPVVVPPPAPTVVAPPLPIQPVVKPDDFVIPPPKPVLLPAPALARVTPAPAKLHVAKQPAKTTTLRHQETSSAAKGAVQAQPDELQNQPPEYPEESRAAAEQGVVILRAHVTANGQAATVSILHSSGYFRLDQAARRAVEHWKFHPGLVAGIPAPSEADVPVRFTLQ